MYCGFTSFSRRGVSTPLPGRYAPPPVPPPHPSPRPDPGPNRCRCPARSGAAASAQSQRVGCRNAFHRARLSEIGRRERLRGNRQVLNGIFRRFLLRLFERRRLLDRHRDLFLALELDLLDGLGRLDCRRRHRRRRARHVEPDDLIAQLVECLCRLSARPRDAAPPRRPARTCATWMPSDTASAPADRFRDSWKRNRTSAGASARRSLMSWMRPEPP